MTAETPSGRLSGAFAGEGGEAVEVLAHRVQAPGPVDLRPTADTPPPRPIMTTESTLGRGLLPAALVPLTALLVVTACRATGDEPKMPTDAAGGALYQANCVACHGPYGAGDGRAAAALDVRPRDFRRDPFYYVSVREGGPTDADLVRTIGDGRPGGEMPAHPWLTPAEVQSLASYVRDLNRLGWEERLAAQAGEQSLSASDIAEIATERAAAGEPVEIPPPSAGFRVDHARGRQVYMASCASCHGDSGHGDGIGKPLDERGRPISVRDLTRERFRGGTSGEAIYRRIVCGIPGTPMPAAQNIAPDDVWQLVDYVRYLAGIGR